MEQGGGALAAGPSGEETDAEVPTDPERVLEMDNPVHGAVLEDVKIEHLEEPLPESGGITAVGDGGHAAAWGSIKNEDHEVFKNPVETHFEFRATAANSTPPPTFGRFPSRSRKHPNRTQFNTPVSGASSSAAVTGPPEGVSAMADGDQGAVQVTDEKQRDACVVFGATVANATPPSTYRLLPFRSRKQSAPTRVIAAGAAASSDAQGATDASPPASLSSTLPSGLHIVTRSALDFTVPMASSDVNGAASSSSYRLPSRGRKQPRPDHFIPEEAEARALAKARRSNIVLDQYLSSLVHGSPESMPEWVSNVTADGARGQTQRQRGTEGFKIRDSSRHVACVRKLRPAAISRLGDTGDPSSSAPRPGCALPSATAPGCPPEEADESGRILGVLAILGASLALSVVSCVLFYIVGGRSESGPSRQQQKE